MKPGYNLIKRGQSQIQKYSWSSKHNQAKNIDYEVYFDINYFDSYTKGIDRAIDRCITRAGFSINHQSTMGPVKVIATGHKKLNPQREIFGKPKMVLTVDMLETEALIFKHFGQSYDILAGEPVYSSGTLAYEVNESDDMEYVLNNEVSRWKITGEGTNLLLSLLTLMAIEKVISFGTYVVTTRQS